MKIIHCLALLSYIFSAPYSLAADQNVVAIVDKQIITDADVFNRVNLLMVLTGMHDSSDVRQTLEKQVMQDLINEKLLKKAADKYKISVGPEEVGTAIKQMAQANNMTTEKLYSVLKAKNCKTSEFENQTHSNILRSKIIKMAILPLINISDLEVEETKNQVISEMKTEEVSTQYEIAEIMIASTEPNHIITTLQAQLALGIDFSALAAEFSQSATAEGGGKVGWVMASQLPKEVAAALTKVAIGKTTAPIRTADGYLILKVIDKKITQPNRKEAILSPEQIKEILEQKKVTMQLQALIRKLRQQAFIEIKK
jgi:peptidyl-prolyl cis-trans isomerase SurA